MYDNYLDSDAYWEWVLTIQEEEQALREIKDDE